jgi:hypothetical protein
LFFLIILFCGSVGSAQTGGYYRWVDKDGRVHFSNAPPGDAKEATPLGIGDRPRDARLEQIQHLREVITKLYNLISRAEFLIQARSNSTANKTELSSIASQLEDTLKEYGNRANLAIAADPSRRKDITEAVSTTRDKVEMYVSTIRKYVGAKTILEQAEREKQREVTEEVRIALRNRPAHAHVWNPYSNPSRLVQVGMSESEVESIAGKPDKKEFYTETRQGRFIAIEGWYYVNDTGTQTSLLEFDIDTRSLIAIRSRP